jgi:hypothetical protein
VDSGHFTFSNKTMTIGPKATQGVPIGFKGVEGNRSSVGARLIITCKAIDHQWIFFLNGKNA